MRKRVVVIGGGLVGLGTALQFSRKDPSLDVTVLEKEPGVCRHQSGNNSGVLHCGLYYKPGSLKARMAVEGIRQMVAFCQENGIPHEVCGKLVVAVTEDEVPRLRELESRGRANGLEGLRWIGPDEIREREPHAAGVAALEVPQEGIVDYKRVAEVMAARIVAAGGRVVTGARVESLARRGSEWHAETTQGSFVADLVVNCAGLHSDRVAALDGTRRDVRIVPFRGEYFKLKPERQHLVRHLIYPVPDPKFPFLGVHFTRMIHGGVEAGPNAVLALSREGYNWGDIRLGDVWDAVSFSGLWRFLCKYPRMCFDEIRRSLSKELFCASLQRLVPEVRVEDLEHGGAGVRAQAMSPSGDLVQDFHLEERPGALHVINAPSPGATASLAIGGEIVRRAAALLS